MKCAQAASKIVANGKETMAEEVCVTCVNRRVDDGAAGHHFCVAGSFLLFGQRKHRASMVFNQTARWLQSSAAKCNYLPPPSRCVLVIFFSGRRQYCNGRRRLAERGHIYFGWLCVDNGRWDEDMAERWPAVRSIGNR